MVVVMWLEQTGARCQAEKPGRALWWGLPWPAGQIEVRTHSLCCGSIIVLYYFNLLKYKPQSRENTVAALYI